MVLLHYHMKEYSLLLPHLFILSTLLPITHWAKLYCLKIYFCCNYFQEGSYVIMAAENKCDRNSGKLVLASSFDTHLSLQVLDTDRFSHLSFWSSILLTCLGKTIFTQMLYHCHTFQRSECSFPCFRFQLSPSSAVANIWEENLLAKSLTLVLAVWCLSLCFSINTVE